MFVVTAVCVQKKYLQGLRKFSFLKPLHISFPPFVCSELATKCSNFFFSLPPSLPPHAPLFLPPKPPKSHSGWPSYCLNGGQSGLVLMLAARSLLATFLSSYLVCFRTLAPNMPPKALLQKARGQLRTYSFLTVLFSFPPRAQLAVARRTNRGFLSFLVQSPC